MDLNEYFEKTGQRKEFFASKIGVSSGTIYNICSGRQEPTLSVASIIEEFTLGLVTCKELSHHKYRLKESCDKQPNAEKAKSEIKHD